MPDDHLYGPILGFFAAFLILGGLLAVVGVDDFVQQITRADPWLVGLVLIATLGWLAAWGVGLRVVLGVIGVELSLVRSFLAINGAMFSNNVTPFGQAGGEPITALLISRMGDTEYERSLAAIASLDTLNFIPSTTLALVGVGYWASQVTFSRRLRVATAAIVLLAVVIPSAALLAWRARRRIKRLAVRVLTPILRAAARVLPGLTAPTRRGIGRRVERFWAAIERVGTSRRGLAIALGASAVGWAFQMLALWLAFLALGVSIPPSVLLFVVPVGAMAGITPLPGGTGGIEAVMVALLSSLPGVGVPLGVALAAVVIFRGAVYWLPVGIGGVVMSLNGIDAL